MSFKDLYREKIKREYCGIDLAKLNKKKPKINVCNNRDFYSSFTYKTLIEQNKHLPFFKRIKNEFHYFNDKQIGVAIRWLYRGMTFDEAMNKASYEYEKQQRFMDKAIIANRRREWNNSHKIKL